MERANTTRAPVQAACISSVSDVLIYRNRNRLGTSALS